jgi:hypothetical protein
MKKIVRFTKYVNHKLSYKSYYSKHETSDMHKNSYFEPRVSHNQILCPSYIVRSYVGLQSKGGDNLNAIM